MFLNKVVFSPQNCDLQQMKTNDVEKGEDSNDLVFESYMLQVLQRARNDRVAEQRKPQDNDFKISRAQDAYKAGDARATIEEHTKPRDHTENHGDEASEYVKSIVFGGLDGIMTTFAIVNAAAGGGGDWKMVLLLGLSNVVADGFSMGFGEFVGGDAERDHAINERQREEWEVEHCLEDEKAEMVAIYQERGLSEADATTMVDILAKDPKIMVDFMMVDELGLLVDIEDKWGPLKQGVVMFLSFIIFGSVPILPYLSKTGSGLDGTFLTALFITAAALAILGAVKGRLTGLSMVSCALVMLFNGAVSGVVSFLAGLIVQSIVGQPLPV